MMATTQVKNAYMVSLNVFKLLKHLCIASHTLTQNNYGDKDIRSTNAELNWLTYKTLTAKLYASRKQIKKK